MCNVTVVNFIKISCAILLLSLSSNSVHAGVGGFYKEEDRYRGFYWFEDQKNNMQPIELLKFHYPTPEEATSAIAERKKALDDARAQMVELSFRRGVPPEMFRQAIVKYKKLEAKMYDGAIALVHAADMANFTNPEIADIKEFPTNVFANKIKRITDEKQNIEIIQEFAKKFDLLLFTSDNCPYCKAFAPVIANFAKNHGFTLDITSLDSKAGKIASSLGINSVPTLIAVSKDSKELFEISRGFSSASELEASILLAKSYSEEQSQKFNKNKR